MFYKERLQKKKMLEGRECQVMRFDRQRGRGSEQGGALETTAINVSDGNNMSRGREDVEARMDPRNIFRIKWTEIIG